MSLLGKVALVTGAAQGLGKAFSEAMLKRGAKVCLADVQREKGELTTAAFQQQYGQDSAMFVKCDVTSSSDMKSTFAALKAKFGQLDIMVNNAGIEDEARPERLININVIGVVTGTNLAIDAMSRDKGGNGGIIINVASAAALTTKAFPIPVYTASKFAVLGFTQTWARNPSLKRQGLRFACLCPSFTETDILHSSASEHDPDMQAIVAMTGINEVSTVAEGFTQLVEDEFCNGAVMVITRQHGIQFHKRPLASPKL